MLQAFPNRSSTILVVDSLSGPLPESGTWRWLRELPELSPSERKRAETDFLPLGMVHDREAGPGAAGVIGRLSRIVRGPDGRDWGFVWVAEPFRVRDCVRTGQRVVADVIVLGPAPETGRGRKPEHSPDPF